jgi:hypothetical protein
MLAIAISIAAIVVSSVTFGLNYRASKIAERRLRIPVLVFVYDGVQGWLLRNVGNGPALNIEVAQKVVYDNQPSYWVNPVRVPPIARDKEVVLSWLGHDNLHGLGAVYEDFLGADEGTRGRVYTVTCSSDRNLIVPERHLPAWPEADIVASWQAAIAPENQ